MRSTDSDSEASGDLELHSFEQLQSYTASQDKDLEIVGVDSVQLARFRAACRQKAAAQKIRESEARARALAVGSATEELRREQKKRKKAVERTKQCEAALEHAESTLQQLQYTNSKLEQQLASTEAAGRIAADCSHRSLRNLRDALCSVEADTADKFAQGQQQVQHLISLTKQLQSYINSSCSNSERSSPAHTQHHLQVNNSSSRATQAISSIFQALAVLGQLLVPCSAVLQDDDSALPTATPNGAARERPRSAGLGCRVRDMVPSASDTAASATNTASNTSSKDASCLAAQSAIHQVRLQDLAAEKTALQHRCDALQQQCDESQQKLQRQAGSCAELCQESQAQCAQQLAEVASLQAERLQLQNEVDALQQSLQSAQSALQSLRDQHEQQTTRLANANAEVLQLRSHVSKLDYELRQQQQDAASALCIVSNREASSANARTAAAAGGGARRSPGCSNLLSNLARPGSAAPALGELGSPKTAIRGGNVVGSELGQEGSRYGGHSSRVYEHHQQQQHDHWAGLYQGNSTVLGTAGHDAAHQTLGQTLLQQLQHEQQQRQQQEQHWQQQHGITDAAGSWDGLRQHTTTTVRPLSGEQGDYNQNRYATSGDSHGRPDYWRSTVPAAIPHGGISAWNAAADTTNITCTRLASWSATAAAAADSNQPQQQERQSVAGIGIWDQRTTPGTGQEGVPQPAATGAECKPGSSARSTKNHSAGDGAAISTSWQQQQHLTAAERHRALVADADAALARLAACRRAAAVASPTVPGQGVRGCAGVNSNRSDSQWGSRAAEHPVPWQPSGGISSIAANCVAAGVDTARYAGDYPRGQHSKSQPAGVADLLGSRYLDQYARQCTAGRLFSPDGRGCVSTSTGGREFGQAGASAKYTADLGGGGAGHASKQSRIRLQELQQELDDIDDDFAHAEAQLQAATARLSGNAAVC